MKKKAVYYSINELADRGAKNIPEEFQLSTHLIYSSPATLSYNSPGAKGFGVKRGGLAIPDSVMLIISPGCCARNTSGISSMKEYANRFFYLTMDETDLVTGRHLTKIPEAVAEIVRIVEKRPSVVMLCATCADALLGTDFERVSRKAEEYAGVKVRPCYMYALTREGTKPPMTALRESIYSLLEKRERKADEVNLLGYFAETDKNSELFSLLKMAGVKRINEIASCKNIDEFYKMSEANFNIVLNPEASYAAYTLSERLGTPYIELKRFYSIERIERQYRAFFKAAGLDASSEDNYLESKKKLDAFCDKYRGIRVSIGECINADPFELALALTEMGLVVAEIFADVTEDNYPYINRLAKISPDTKVYCNQDPSMYYYDAEDEIDISLGADAAYYRKEVPNLKFNEDIQPFGFQAVEKLLTEMEDILSGNYRKENAPAENDPFEAAVCLSNGPRGFRSVLTPFAPDQSGASAVFFGIGVFSVIVDAGGCAGNVCGFDEPRWTAEKGLIFSAGLRDMDAILGRDKELVKKIEKAAANTETELISLIMTPVPAITATDPKALSRMCKNATGIDTLAVSTNGIDLYDKGIEKAETALAEYGIKRQVIGLTPLDYEIRDEDKVYKKWRENGGKEDILVVSAAGVEAAELSREKNGLTYAVEWPFADEDLEGFGSLEEYNDSKILIIHSQVRANSIRNELRKKLKNADIRVAGFFIMRDEFMEENDIRFTEESELSEYLEREDFTLVIGDNEFKKLVRGTVPDWRELKHFAVSG